MLMRVGASRRTTLVSPALSFLTGWALMITACAKTTQDKTADSTSATAGQAAAAAACPTDNGGITLPSGFCATVFADSIGHARHIAVAQNGDVYINTWSGRYYQGAVHPGGFIVALRDTNNDGKADVVKRFGTTSGGRSEGGTGLAIYHDAVYAEEGDTITKRIVRYALSRDSLGPSTARAEIIVNGLPGTGEHPMHPFAIDGNGNMYIDVASATNSCQVKNRTAGSPGQKPCAELQTRAGLWKYNANKTNQRFSAAGRYATGIRNGEGIALDGSGQLYSTQHGRDQLVEMWPKLYTVEQGQNQPSEELLRIEEGGDYGWPYCYHDYTQGKLVQAPEYGGDGKSVGDCATRKEPAAYFPAHWAPNGLVFYNGAQFPAKYKGGALIAFHGSWNRAPGPQGGYKVVFLPFSGGNPTDPAKFETFADGFVGGPVGVDATDRAKHRPVSLAVAPDGSLFITDDRGGRVWKVVYRGAAK